MKLKSYVMVGLWCFVSNALGQSWTIGNAQIERRITLIPHPGCLRRGSLISRRTTISSWLKSGPPRNFLLPATAKL